MVGFHLGSDKVRFKGLGADREKEKEECIRLLCPNRLSLTPP